MADVLVRKLDDKLVKRLKKRAEEHGRSLQGEVKVILEEAAARPTAGEQRKRLERVQKMFAGRIFSDSTDLIREDRDSR